MRYGDGDATNDFGEHLFRLKVTSAPYLSKVDSFRQHPPPARLDEFESCLGVLLSIGGYCVKKTSIMIIKNNGVTEVKSNYTVEKLI